MINEIDIEPLVSIAIITYNQREYLKCCIDSCLAQDYPNIEIVVSDDGSDDGTQQVLEEYVREFPGKFIINLAKKNQGITKNCNAVLSLCNGSLIAIVGGDDLFKPEKISRQVKVFQKQKNVVICGTYSEIINDKGIIINNQFDYKKKSNPFYSQGELISSNNSIVPVVSYMVRKDALPVEGFDYRLPVASDSLFYYRVAEKGSVYIVKEFLTCYRVHYSHAKKLGYNDDMLVSLALTEFYYPHLTAEVNIVRFSLNVINAKQYLKRKLYNECIRSVYRAMLYSANVKLYLYLFLRVWIKLFR